jgi:hypothetical protein
MMTKIFSRSNLLNPVVFLLYGSLHIKLDILQFLSLDLWSMQTQSIG